MYNLPSEEAARRRRQIRKATVPKSTHVYADSGSDEDEAKKKKKKKKQRKLHQFTLDSYKLHSLGGYAKAIRQFGTTDNYNTQTVCIL